MGKVRSEPRACQLLDRKGLHLASQAQLSDDNVLPQAKAWKDAGHSVAIATVINTWGSAPRPVGSQLVIEQGGQFVGSVSGGCIEGAVVEEAMATIDDGKCRTLDFGVADEDAWAVGLACGGDIRIYVEPLE